MNQLEKKIHVTKIAQFYCARSVENLDHNLFMHTDKCEIERLNCVTMYILSYFNAIGHAQYLTGEDNVCRSEMSAVKNI
jgi:hypothetical protein